MKKAEIRLSARERIGAVDRRLPGQFLEVHRDCIYGGIYQPGHPLSDEMGFRKDLIQEIRTLGVPTVRIPGGNYCSGYHWKNGIGPRDQRPVRLEMAWHTLDNNQVGTDEYLYWTEQCGMEPALTVNLGTGTPEEAAEWVEYCNLTGGTYYSDLRKKNGHAEPYGVKTWYVGNEMDGSWQMGFLNPQEYGRKARHACDLMRWTDPNVELIVCGSSTDLSAQCMEWDRIVLEETYDQADLLSIHLYFPWPGQERRGEYLAAYHRMDAFIRQIVAACDYVKAHKRSGKTMMIAFDEWAAQCETRPRPEEFRYHPGLIDTVTVGGVICTLLNHADRIKIGGQTMLVNALSVLFTKPEGIIRSGYYPLIKQMIDYGRGDALHTQVSAPELTNGGEGVCSLAAASVWNEETETLTVFAANLGDEELETQLALGDFPKGLRLVEHSAIYGDGTDFDTPNTLQDPDRLFPKQEADSAARWEKEGVLRLRSCSWNLLRFSR